MIDKAGVGDDVLTQGGIYGTITEVEGDDIVVDLGNGLEVHMTRRGIAAVLPPEEDEEADDAEEDEIDAEAEEVFDADVESDDEASVSAEEEAVTSAADADPAAAERR
jgi:preprotein translocase subunit YajC